MIRLSGLRRASTRLARCHKGLAAVEFALIAPILLMLMFGIILYSLYFSVYMGVREAASEGARAAVAGLSTAERTTLATARARAVMTSYAGLAGVSTTPTVEAVKSGTGLFRVRVTYNISSSPIYSYSLLLPMPSSTIIAEVTVANGAY